MSELSRLIKRLRRGISRSAPYIKTIRYPELLVVSLQELNDLIGNDKIKDSVATQVSHLIMIKRRSIEDSRIKEDEAMLNTVLYGPPGTGKTLVGNKLAKIWYSLGYLDGSRSTKVKKQELGDMLKELFKENNGGGDNSESTGNSGETAMVIYVVLIFSIIFITMLSLSWSFYNKYGAMWAILLIVIVILIIASVGFYMSALLSDSSSTNNTASATVDHQEPNTINTSTSIIEVPRDDQIIKVVTRADFVDRYLGWTSIKTNKLLEQNLGKVLFVDEAYSLINGPHDEFGIEATTALNLFLSQRPKEIIVIFAGYKDLLQTGVYSVQPGLKRRFMWQFSCDGYSGDELFDIFKMQLNNKGWGINKEDECREIIKTNMNLFPAFGGDTDRLGFFSELEHSRDFIANDKDMAINMLEPKHILRGLEVLRENNMKDNDDECSTNPIANMMKLMSGKQNNSSDLDMSVLNNIRERMTENKIH